MVGRSLASLPLSAFLLALPLAVAQAQSGSPAVGAPRHQAKVVLGEASVHVEHGQPPWSDERLGQIGMVPVGQPWRMGSEGLTTFTVHDAPVFFGTQLVEPGRYGFNLLHAGENLWNFVIFEPKNVAISPFQMVGDEKNQQILTSFTSDAAEVVDALTIDLAGEGEAGSCTLRWGPLRVSAPLTAVAVSRNELEINGHEATASWWARPLPEGTDPTAAAIVGRIELEIDGESCSMNVYALHEGGNLVALLRNVEREGWQNENAAIETGLRQLETVIQQYPQAEAQVGPMAQALRRRFDKNEILLEMTAERPDNLRFAAEASEAPAGRVRCDLIPARSGLRLEITFAGLRALIRVDETAFELKASG
jgi:hypothetical protein